MGSRLEQHRIDDIVNIGKPMVKPGMLLSMGKRGDRERTAYGLRMYKARLAAGLKQGQVVARVPGLTQGMLSDIEGPNETSKWTPQLATVYEEDAHYLATGQRRSPTMADGQQMPDNLAGLVRRLMALPPDGRDEAIAVAIQAAVHIRTGGHVEVRPLEVASDSTPSQGRQPGRGKQPTSARATMQKSTGERSR
jgi:hypothetical protein